MQRLFAAIKVIPEVTLLSNYRELKSLLHNDKITWVGEQNIHITLKFLATLPKAIFLLSKTYLVRLPVVITLLF